MSAKRSNTLYLVRHGENLANITKEFSYKIVDYPLTPKGVLQAQQTAAFLQSIPFNAIYSSPLKRAHQTAEIIARTQALPVIVEEEFREINIGEIELRPPTAENWQQHNDIIDQWFKGNPTAAFPGGENCPELVARGQRGLLSALDGRDEQCILIAAHGGILAVLVFYLCPQDRKMINGLMNNCAITKLEVVTGGGSILQGRLSSWASVAHLSGEAAELISPLFEYEKA